ncbi:MAG: Uncharacterized protein G01um101424_120 [Parcubacteria group bacterium Gr01-1014_24]|nr:MAG: Uncharacterized protein G01um101424_120 [Parcubacteria group bacterium Gr01-1014_24]
MFIILLFFSKNKSIFKNPLDFARGKQENKLEQEGLTYGNEILGNLVNKDTDLDGVLDWEESLWGTNPNKKDTNGDGVGDDVEIENLKLARLDDTSRSGGKLTEQDNENLTETDKFSREFFATIATLNQSGQMDQATVDKLSSSLAEHIQNSPPRKVFLLSDVKIIKDDSVQAVKNYNNNLNKIHDKYQTERTVIDVLQEFIADENNINAGVLLELDPIVEQTQNVINELVKMSVPQSLSVLHLDMINAMERLVENISDIKLYDTDVIVSLSAISQYDQNTTTLQSAINSLAGAIGKKLNN